MPPPGEFSQPDLYSKKPMVTCSTRCRRILVYVEKTVSSDPTTQTKIAKANSKFYHWRYNTVEERMSGKPVANGKNCQY